MFDTVSEFEPMAIASIPNFAVLMSVTNPAGTKANASNPPEKLA
jgi:hypothetical protein